MFCNYFSTEEQYLCCTHLLANSHPELLQSLTQALGSMGVADTADMLDDLQRDVCDAVCPLFDY